MTIAYHYFPSSHWSRVMSLVIAEKQLEVERHFVDIRHNATFEPSYMRINPKGVVPTLVHDGQSITNSLRIAAHLDEVVPEPALYQGLGDDAVREWVAELEAFPLMLFSYSVWVKGLRGERSSTILDDKVERAQRYAREYPELAALYTRKAAFFSAFRAQVYDAEHVAAETERCRRVLDELANAVSTRLWLGGEHYCLADAIATSVLYRLLDLDVLVEWRADPSHGLDAYYRRLCARPSFATVFENDPLIV